ncbi:UMP kinase [Planococcus sp. S3-L1]|uniref:UMP kinase n=1 Tax=Planococcus sp. S3-L1 TaxID=3046200 RepID=UPI0024B91F9C|nr:UMP kinase [Planococcus sp. S3-L1]MDJ0332711.1 UMP kinase [Planococcus sp. S3-L1]
MKTIKRVLIKLSGGALATKEGESFDHQKLEHIADEILSITDMDIEVALVIGGGNIFRGSLADKWNIDRVEADNIGTLGTIMNSLMLRGVLKSKTDKEIRVMTSIPVPSVAEPYIQLRAKRHLEKGSIVIFGGGNGQPFVTTDYPSVQRAIETDCDAIFVAKQGVDGVFDSDPNQHVNAKMYRTLNYDDILKENIKVMDQSALLLAKEFDIAVNIFNFDKQGEMKRIVEGKQAGTIVSKDPSEFYVLS